MTQNSDRPVWTSLQGQGLVHHYLDRDTTTLRQRHGTRPGVRALLTDLPHPCRTDALLAVRAQVSGYG
ncbi:hypothetical protein ACIA8E_36175 [Streptomyces sp. NPDC051664]|uniref:hypothetical protein n=1 Tax=Streptomyces sp. NPDC051664 TaxID=3365668 RepID=UPI0037A36BF2